jgi:DUF4097 and DUF4098 domain-containing protein YvlB
MELEHRIGFIGIGVAAVALIATQTDLLSLSLSSLNPFNRASDETVTQSVQRGRIVMLEREFEVGAGSNLSVDVADADVTVRSGSAREASVKVLMRARDRDWGRQVFDRMNFDVGSRGDEISVSAQSPRFDRSEWNGDNGGVGFQNCNAIISTGDGDITMSDLTGDFDLETSDGDISVGTLSGTLHLRTSDGDVSAEGLSGSTISVRTSDGDVRIRELAGPAEISTSDGDINVTLDRAEDIRLRTGDGDITIYANQSIQANVDFSGEEVQMASGFLLSEGRVSENGAQGVLNGGGPTLHAHTGDGTISIRDRGNHR